MKNSSLLNRIKNIVKSTEPNASVILFGSYARHENNSSSDIDILILVDNETITQNYQQKLKYPLYDLEFESGKIISPIIISKKDWEQKHKITPFYYNVKKEGVVL